MTKLYVPRTGSRITKSQAQFIGEIAERHVGRASKDVALALVKASRNPGAPTHSLFRGTNAEKARRWDIGCALRLLGDVVEYRVENGGPEPRHEVRAFMRLAATEDEPSICVNTATAVSDDVLRDRVLAEVDRRLKSARMFAAGIKELVEIIDAAIADVARVRAARKRKRAAVPV